MARKTGSDPFEFDNGPRMPASESFDGQGDEGDVLSFQIVKSACHFPMVRGVQSDAVVGDTAVDGEVQIIS